MMLIVMRIPGFLEWWRHSKSCAPWRPQLSTLSCRFNHWGSVKKIWWVHGLLRLALPKGTSR